MKLSGRTVIFNYLLELDGTDVELLRGVVAVIVRKDLKDEVSVACKVDETDISARLSVLASNLDVALDQIKRTREQFKTGNVPASPMRGMSIKTVENAGELGTPLS